VDGDARADRRRRPACGAEVKGVMHLIHLDLHGDLDALIEAGGQTIVDALAELLTLEAWADGPDAP
jgi:hypothetical protein